MRHNISKCKKAHDRAFTIVMCSLYVLGSMCLVCEQKNAPTDPEKVEEHNAFIPIKDDRCEQAAKIVHGMCVGAQFLAPVSDPG